MSIFLSQEEQLFTIPVISVGLRFTPNENMLKILSVQFTFGSERYYLFNKIKVFEIKDKK